MPEAAAETLAIDVAASGDELLHLRDVRGERNRRRTDVRVGVELEPRAVATRIS
jgi:hypothetical protein